MKTSPSALIADDEPLLREVLQGLLAEHWPALRIVAQARNGLEALEQFEAQQPQVCFLDIHMPGLSGIEVARNIGGRAHTVFITAFDHYALDAFKEGVFDYVVKPIQIVRLIDTVGRLQERLRREEPVRIADEMFDRLARHVQGPASTYLRWLRASVGQCVRLIPIDDVDFVQADEKYTLVAWRGDKGKLGDTLIRMPLKALMDQLDPTKFSQVHRSVIVNLDAVSHVTRGENETGYLHLKHRSDVLPISRTWMYLFKAD